MKAGLSTARVLNFFETQSDGKGNRLSIYFSGCRVGCKGCHNLESWDFRKGNPLEEMKEEIKDFLRNKMFVQNITLTGGNPMDSPKPIAAFVKELKEEFQQLNVWLFSGYTLDQILADQDKKELLMECDTIIDGKFEEELKDLTLEFRGSKNQRILYKGTDY